MPPSTPPLDSIAADAEKMAGLVAMTIPDPGHIWLTLPDGAMPGGEGGPSSLASMKLPDKRHAVLLVRQIFLKQGVCSFNVGGRRILVEFQPAIIAGRTKDGRAFARTDSGLAITDAKPAEPEAPEIPDTGELLQSLQTSTQSLQAIDDLLTDPSAISSADEETRAAAHEKLAAAKDKALAGLGSLSTILAEGDKGDREAWLAKVAEASSKMVEDMADLDGLPEEAKAGKLKALDELKHTVARYFATVDANSPVIRKFSAGIGELVLKERREVVQSKKDAIENDLEEAYSALISVVQSAMPKGSTVSLLPLPRIEPAHGCWGKIVFNMCHVMMAVQNRGFHMRLDIDPRNKRVWNEFRAWEDRNPPQIHIVSQSVGDRTNARRRKPDAAPEVDISDFFA
ncbi:MAG: hypothetical protein WCJ64_20620 [Rhodospirillaceae bacterium]